MFIRLLIFSVVVWWAWKMLTGGKKQRTKTKKESALKATKMVKCALCETHLPIEQALQDEKHWFCDAKHKAQFKDS